ncbi:divergent polysaccharide deacteylase family protein [Salipiger bermudensis]|uniref:divergent polysaccharide deacteylase family protein n=1 Tax=Salipiger bermudensis TaxID=344736 RepID=UPI001CD65DB1|nr:divergent polysaccharide deacteylase family protein [Salipiger bermudensis]MCA0960924.1 divergent polysaccharide deacetylase family protein [Salipiger bermudensis]
MARGFLAGAIIGTVVSGVTLGTVSVLTGPPLRERAALPPEAEVPGSAPAKIGTAGTPEAETTAVGESRLEPAREGAGEGVNALRGEAEVSEEPEVSEEAEVTEVAPSDSDMVADTSTPESDDTTGAEGAAASEPDVKTGAAPADGDTPALAEAEEASPEGADAPAAPDTDASPGDAAALASDPASDTATSRQDAAPQTSSEDGVETVTPAAGTPPEEPAGAETVSRPGRPGEVTAAAPEPSPGISAASDTPPEAETVLDAPTAPAEPDTNTASMEMASADTPERRDTVQPDAPQGEDAPELSTQTPAAPLPAPLPAPLVPGENTRPRVSTLPGRAGADGGEDGTPTIGTRAGSLVERGASEEASRLPSIGEAVPAEPSAAPKADPSPQPPLERYAVSVEAEDGAPRMAIVLIDDGSGPLGPDTVGAFPFPVSFAIPASHPDAADTARAYRDAGFEVLAVAGVPEGAQATDVEVTLEGSLGAVPEAVAVMEALGDGLQGSRAISEQAAQYLGASGHGLLMQPKGLNTGEALARREDVPTVTVFRDFDGDGQDPRVMRRFLDQAAFKARQEGDVVMLGRLRADTVSALLLWGLQDRASSVALVPISLVLRDSLGED